MLENELSDDALHSDESAGLRGIRKWHSAIVYRTHVDEDVPLNGHCTHNRSNEKPRYPHPRTNGGTFSIGFDVSDNP